MQDVVRQRQIYKDNFTLYQQMQKVQRRSNHSLHVWQSNRNTGKATATYTQPFYSFNGKK
jgi:hypothetical protein